MGDYILIKRYHASRLLLFFCRHFQQHQVCRSCGSRQLWTCTSEGSDNYRRTGTKGTGGEDQGCAKKKPPATQISIRSNRSNNAIIIPVAELAVL